MKITKEQVEHVAMLARLELSEDEKELYTGQLDAILAYAAKLEKLDTTDIPPTAHVLPLHNVFREDTVKQSISREAALDNAPDAEDGFFKVPRIV
ncbi:MAG TPA: Asp-tRNA(Asn)/Glu-tRNA(Gln) amidotransferase subunit GatC [Desulfobacteria bacterium]|nr:Asp-tRNA(Asn)/Glu-tRNA(Gln) amidotransferase subunit GatC [Desulfobacteria bacterium]